MDFRTRDDGRVDQFFPFSVRSVHSGESKDGLGKKKNSTGAGGTTGSVDRRLGGITNLLICVEWRGL